MLNPEELNELVVPLRDDLTSGAAEIALRSIGVFQATLTGTEELDAEDVKNRLTTTARALIDAQPAMAPLFHLGNSVLNAVAKANTSEEVQSSANEALEQFDRRMCRSAEAIADQVFDLVPAGELVFAYSFSSTVVSSLLNARSRGKYFRVLCTEARPAQEGRKLATMLASGGLEVIHTFDTAIGLALPMCRAAFMGCDCVGRPGLVNKVGSWLLATACRELGIPLYALCGTEKFVDDERFFEFEKHERPGSEVWDEAPSGVRVLNRQFEIVPFSHLAGLVTDNGILTEKDVGKYVAELTVHDSLKLEGSAFA